MNGKRAARVAVLVALGAFLLAASPALAQNHVQYLTRIGVKTVWSVAFSPDGRFLLTANEDDGARLWDAATGQQIRSFATDTGGALLVAFSPDSRSVLTANGVDRNARLWDAATGQQIRAFEGDSAVMSVAFSPDGQSVLVGSFGEQPLLFDGSTGKRIRSFEGSKNAVLSVAFSPDGRYALTTDSQTARLWDAATGEQIRLFHGHTDMVSAVAISPDSRTVLTGSYDQTARLWDAATGQQIRSLQGHTDKVSSVAFSPDGRFLLTGSWDGTARLWDAATGQQIRSLQGRGGRVASVAFSPDGRFVLTASDTAALLWDASTGRQLATLLSFAAGAWAVIDPEDHFDANDPDKHPDLLAQTDKNREIKPRQLKIDHYQANLLAAIMNGVRPPQVSIPTPASVASIPHDAPMPPAQSARQAQPAVPTQTSPPTESAQLPPAPTQTAQLAQPAAPTGAVPLKVAAIDLDKSAAAAKADKQNFLAFAIRYAQQLGFTLLIDDGGADFPVLYAEKSTEISQAAISAFAAEAAQAASSLLPHSAPETAAPTPVTARIALVEFQDAVMGTDEGKKLIERLQTKYQPEEDRLKSENSRIELLKKQLKAGHLSTEENKTLQASIDRKTEALTKETNTAEAAAQDEMQKGYSEVASKFYDSLASYAPANGYTVVLQKAIKPEIILWSAAGIRPEDIAAQGTDITATVVKVHNSKMASIAQASATQTPQPSSMEPDRGFARTTPAQSAAFAPHVPIPHNYALIFATDDYAHWPHLTNPIPDADALSQTLTSLYNFQVEEIKNPSNEQILQKLTEYLHRTFQPQDQLLIFFSGHGYFDNDLGQGFIVPANAPLVQDDLGHTRLLAHDTIMRYVNRIPSLHVVLIIDACFAGTLDRKIADSGLRGDASLDIYAHASLPEILQRKEPKRTRRYFASGGKDFVPDGKPGHHSPFMSALLVTLNQAADRKGYATLDDIQLGLNTVVPEPRWGDIQDENEPGADFILLTPNAVNQLAPPN